MEWVPPDEETLGVTRRQFFNRSIVSLFAFSSLGLGGAMLAQLWPSGAGGFGGKIRVGTLEDINKAIADGNGFAYYPEARMWVTAYPSGALPKAEAVYSPLELVAMKAGIVTLWQRCPHLGCQVPQCETSQWFECPPCDSAPVQPGGREAGRARTAEHGPVRSDHRQRRGDGRHRHVRTDQDPPIWYQHHRPGGRGPPLRRRAPSRCIPSS